MPVLGSRRLRLCQMQNLLAVVRPSMAGCAVFCLAGLSYCLQAGAAGDGAWYEGDLSVNRTFGTTSYDIKLTEHYVDAPRVVELTSFLEFPFDCYVLGLQLGAGGSFWRGKPWEVRLLAWRSVSDPTGVMADEDHYLVPEYDWNIFLSSTESDASLGAYAVDANARVALAIGPDFSFGCLAGYRYLDLSYDISGIRGWYLDESLTRVHLDGYAGVKVLDYRVRYALPYFGVLAEIRVPRTFSLDIEAAYSGSASATDHDDHIVRRKASDGHCDGNAVFVALNALWIRGVHPAVGLAWGADAEAVRIRTEGSQDQVFYGDDPGTEDDETGLRFEGIEDRIEFTCQTLSLFAGLRF